jgi:phosphoribosylformylglycinamidine cyclo-ligase
MGIGMIAVVAPGDADLAVGALVEHGLSAWVVGQVERREGSAVELVGEYR